MPAAQGEGRGLGWAGSAGWQSGPSQGWLRRDPRLPGRAHQVGRGRRRPGQPRHDTSRHAPPRRHRSQLPRRGLPQQPPGHPRHRRRRQQRHLPRDRVPPSHVEHNTIVRNGFRENGPGGQPFTFAGTDFWFWGIGREGISVDGSYENTITGNAFTGNSAGGIFLYKNCGEYPDRPAYFERRYPAEHNLIEGNTFVAGTHGIWVGSRMGENTVPMDCTDPAYIDEPLRRVVLDRANDNVLRVNRFEDVTYGIRVEDDGTTVEGNSFTATSPDRHAVVVGTPLRTTVLGHPVTGTRLVGNAADIPGNADPYRWVTGQATPSTRATSPTARPRPCARASSRPARRSSSSSPWRSPVPTAAHPPRNPTSPSRPSAPSRPAGPKPTTSTGCRARRGRRPWPPGWRRRGRPRAGSGARPPGRRCASGRRASR